MQIEAFDEDLRHREIVPYSPVYAELFASLRQYAQSQLEAVELIHIGSTAITDLRGKPMLDIVAVTKRKDLRAEQQAFIALGFHRRTVWIDRDDKPYVCGSVNHGRRFNINIH